jgi:hypothetical protein
MSPTRLCALLIALALAACGRQSDEPSSTSNIKQYAFFTWKAHSGDLCFALMTESESHKFIRRWSPKKNAKCGLAELKRELTALPADSHVYWRSLPARGIDYPGDNVIKEITQFAESKGLHLELMPTRE